MLMIPYLILGKFEDYDVTPDTIQVLDGQPEGGITYPAAPQR